MDRNAAAGLLTHATAPPRPSSALRFDLATGADDAQVRRILRDNPMGGSIQLSFEREPDAGIASQIEGGVHQTLVGRRDDGGLFAVGGRSIRTAWINGRPAALGYLSMLRFDADCRNKPRLLQRAYEFAQSIHDADRAAPFYLTSIMADNAAARRVLERGLPGMPKYRFAGEFVTLAIPVRNIRAKSAANQVIRFRAARFEDIESIVRLLNICNAQRQFAPMWTTADLIFLMRRCDLRLEDFRLAWHGTQLVGCAALWDQRRFKQSVVRKYGKLLSRCRRLINLFSAQPRLPAIGEPIAQAYVSHLAVLPNHDDVLQKLIAGLLQVARARQLAYVVMGFPAGFSALPMLTRSLGCRTLRSRLYLVHWPDGAAAAAEVDLSKPIWPEVAVL